MVRFVLCRLQKLLKLKAFQMVIDCRVNIRMPVLQRWSLGSICQYCDNYCQKIIMMTCVKIKTQSIIKFTWNLKDIIIVKNRKKSWTVEA